MKWIWELHENAFKHLCQLWKNKDRNNSFYTFWGLKMLHKKKAITHSSQSSYIFRVHFECFSHAWKILHSHRDWQICGLSMAVGGTQFRWTTVGKFKGLWCRSDFGPQTSKATLVSIISSFCDRTGQSGLIVEDYSKTKQSFAWSTHRSNWFKST